MQLIDAQLTEFMERARSLPKLERSVERRLAHRARAGDHQARKELVEAHLRYVISIAMQYRRYPIPLRELIAEGCVGLMVAVDKFDPDHGTRFVTYAGYWIRAYILDLIVRGTRMAGSGSGPFRSKIYFKLRRERARVALLTPDPKEQRELLAERLGYSEDKVRTMLERLDAHDSSLDALQANTGVTLLDTLEDQHEDQEEQLAASERARKLSERVERALPRLDDRERFIIQKRHLEDRSMSLASLGRHLGVSRERARQLEARAKAKLREELADFAA